MNGSGGAEDREHKNAIERAYYARNREAIRAKEKERYDNWTPEQRERHNGYQRKYRAKNRATVSRWAYRRRVKTQFGLDWDDYEALAVDGCHICGREQNLRIDHDHACCPTMPTCGKCVRGILCHQCNTAIGMLDDSPRRMENAIRYLREWLDRR